MSVNYNNNGQLVNIGNTRVWIGTKAAHNALVTDGNNTIFIPFTLSV